MRRSGDEDDAGGCCQRDCLFNHYGLTSGRGNGMDKWDVSTDKWVVSRDGYTIMTEPKEDVLIKIVARCQTITIASQIVEVHNAGLEAGEEEAADRVAPVVGKLFAAMKTRQMVKIDYGCFHTGYVESIRRETVDMRHRSGIKLSAIKSVKFIQPPADDKVPERWEAQFGIPGKVNAIRGTDNVLFFPEYATSQQTILAAAAPEMRDALEMVSRKGKFSRITVGGCVADRISVEFNPDGWRIITDALEKADGGE